MSTDVPGIAVPTVTADFPGCSGVRTRYATTAGAAGPADTSRAAAATDAHNPAAGTAGTTVTAVAAGRTVGSRPSGCGTGASGLTSQTVSARAPCPTGAPHRQQPRVAAVAAVTAGSTGTGRTTSGAAVAAVAQEQPACTALAS